MQFGCAAAASNITLNAAPSFAPSATPTGPTEAPTAAPSGPSQKPTPMPSVWYLSTPNSGGPARGDDGGDDRTNAGVSIRGSGGGVAVVAVAFAVALQLVSMM
jgi:hypothetical protein